MGTLTENLTVPAHVWNSVSKSEQADVKGAFDVRLIPIDAYGVTVDAQTMDQSQPGNVAGSNLGAAVGSAVYVDRAFRGPNYNYSATANIGAAVLGALIGSLRSGCGNFDSAISGVSRQDAGPRAVWRGVLHGQEVGETNPAHA